MITQAIKQSRRNKKTSTASVPLCRLKQFSIFISPYLDFFFMILMDKMEMKLIRQLAWENKIFFSFYFMLINIFLHKSVNSHFFSATLPPTSLSNHINRNLLQYYKKVKDIVFVGMLFKLPLYRVYFLCAEPKGLKGNCSVSRLVDFYRSKNVCKHSWTTLVFLWQTTHRPWSCQQTNYKWNIQNYIRMASS